MGNGHLTVDLCQNPGSPMSEAPSQTSMPPRSPVRPVVLGVESSCDDTACALLDGEGRVLSSVVSSQLEAHRIYGGVVPEIASREHLRNWPWVSAAALASAGLEFRDVDLVAATKGPGLVGSLLVGLSLGKAIAFALKRPFHAVHHLEGHLYSPFLAPGVQSGEGAAAGEVPDRFVALVVSGGHTTLFRVERGVLETLGATRDDAMGECFDKVGKRVGLPFPGGPWVDALAEAGDPARHPFRVPRCGDSLDFSYSGLKTQSQVDLEALEGHGHRASVDAERWREGLDSLIEHLDPRALDLLAGFRAAAVAQLIDRLERLRRREGIDRLVVSGGAAANRLLRRELSSWAEHHDTRLDLVPLEYSGDNAAMIAWAALLRDRRGEGGDPLSVEAASRLPI